jgi:Icc-related predicted phosphoesterase
VKKKKGMRGIAWMRALFITDLHGSKWKYQPRLSLSLHGHIHESPEVSGRWYAKLGRTICIQPGQLDEFTYVTIDLSTMKFDRIKEQYVTLTRSMN